MEQKNNTLVDFIKHEDKYFIEFLSNFEIIGLTIASIIGLSITSLSYENHHCHLINLSF